MNRRLLTFAGAALALQAACAVGPVYKKPEAPLPAAFREAPPAAEGQTLRPAKPRDEAARGAWWTVFGDPALAALEEQVAVSNLTLAQAEAQFRSARAAAGAAGAGLYPTVGAGAAATRSRTSPGGSRLPTAGSAGAITSVYQLPVTFSYEFDLWGRVHHQIEASVATAQASAADLEAVRLSLTAELALDWYALRGLDEQRRLLRETLQSFEKQLQLTRHRHDQGVVSGVDVAQAETQVETTRAQAIELGVARAQLEHAIAILVGKAPSDVRIPDTAADLAAGEGAWVPPSIPPAVPADLLERRPDVAAAERRMAAANAQIGVARAAWFPSLTLSASGGLQSSVLGELLSLPNRFWSLGPALAETVFDGGRRKAVEAQTVAAYDAAVAAYREAVLTALEGVEDNLSTLRILGEEATQQAAAVAAAERALALAKHRYEGGVTSYLEVLTAQNVALANERTAVDLRTRRMMASVNLVKALGGGWEPGKDAAAK